MISVIDRRIVWIEQIVFQVNVLFAGQDRRAQPVLYVLGSDAIDQSTELGIEVGAVMHADRPAGRDDTIVITTRKESVDQPLEPLRASP